MNNTMKMNERKARLIRLATLILLATLIIPASLYSQRYDRRQIIFNQALRMEAQRDYKGAIEIYKELMQEYPLDEEIAASYLKTLLLTEQHKEAEALLDKHEKAFKKENLIEHKILLFGKKGEMEAAKSIGIKYLKENPGVVNLYHSYSLVYERLSLFETALEVLLMCRKQTGDEHIFAIEMARNYHALNRYKEAIAEYVKHLEKNTGFLFFVTDRINDILNQDSSMIKELEKLLSNSENETLLELLALAFTHIDRYEDAYEIYSRLGPDKLLLFADELLASSHFELAVRGYEEYHATVTDPVQKAEVKVKIVTIQIYARQYEEAEKNLLKLANDEAIKDKKMRYRTHINGTVREMLADLAMRMRKPKSEVMEWLDDAKQFAFNRGERNEIELKKARYLIMLEDYNEAQDIINNTLNTQQQGTRLYNIGFYYNFLLSTMKNSTPPDSLLAELIVSIPSDELTSEALFLSVILNEIQPQNRRIFLQAYRLKNLYRDEEALSSVFKILFPSFEGEIIDSLFLAESYQLQDIEGIDEEVLIIAAQWAYEIGMNNLAQSLYSFPFTKDTLAGYATLKLSEIQKQKEQPYKETIVNYLRENPQNVLSPQLRLLLSDLP